MATPASIASPHDAIGAVRHFNRFYTRQMGVLHEHLLQSQFSLTEVRVLYELAHHENLTAIELREELGLDRGYLSRMLQNFEQRGWIKRMLCSRDRRRVPLALTSKGREVFEPLDRRSSKEVSLMLGRLAMREQARLIGAMTEIETLINSSNIPQSHPASSPQQPYTLRSHRPGDMGWVVQRHGELYWNEYHYDERFEAIVAGVVAHFIDHFDVSRERCWIAERDGERLGTIFLVKQSSTTAKLRLLLVDPSARGLGLGKHLVSECVRFAREAGYRRIVLWTQSELEAARHLYQEAGFELREQEPHSSWGRKHLVSETWELKL